MYASYVTQSELYNRIVRFWETGLTSAWSIKFSPNITKCLNPPQQAEGTDLSVYNLSSAFLLIPIGCALAFITYLAELCFFVIRKP